MDECCGKKTRTVEVLNSLSEEEEEEEVDAALLLVPRDFLEGVIAETKLNDVDVDVVRTRIMQ